MTARTPQAVDDRLARLASTSCEVSFVTLAMHLRKLREDLQALDPDRDVKIRFRHDPSLVFHRTDVVAIRIERDEQVAGDVRIEVYTSFLGLLGTVSPLPTSFTEDVISGEANEDGALRDFYDVLHQRLIGAALEALLPTRPSLLSRVDGTDVMTKAATSACGLDALADSGSGFDRRQWLRTQAIRGRHPESFDALDAALCELFRGIEYKIRVLRTTSRARSAIPARCSLVRMRGWWEPEGTRSGTLREEGLRIELGPLQRREYEALLPGGALYERARSVVLKCVPLHVNVELELRVAAGQEPVPRLGSYGSLRLRRSVLVRQSEKPKLRARVALHRHDGGAVPQFLFSVS